MPEYIGRYIRGVALKDVVITGFRCKCFDALNCMRALGAFKCLFLSVFRYLVIHVYSLYECYSQWLVSMKLRGKH